MKGDTMTTPTDIHEQAAEAEAKAHKLREQARELNAQAEAEQRQQDRETAAARLEWARERRANYPTEHGKPVREARTAFEQAVLNGGDSIGAWVHYMARAKLAAQSDSIADSLEYKIDRDQHEAIAAWIETLRPEVEGINTWGDKYPANPEGAGRNRGWWDETVHPLIGPEDALPGETRLQQINRRLNALAEALGKDVRRKPDDASAVLSLRYTERPRELSMSRGEVSRFERRTYQQAVADVIAQGIEAEAQRMKAEQAAGFDTWRAKHKR